MKITKTQLKQLIKEELKEVIIIESARELLGRINTLLTAAPLDEKGLAALTSVVYDLEQAYPIPQRQPGRGEVQTWSAEDKAKRGY